jgi:flagellar M-ring protein FliF
METAVIPVSDNAIAAAAPTGLGPRLAAMPTRILVSAAIGVVVLVALLVAMAFSLRTSDHKVLFSNLSEKDGAVVIAKLDQLGVDYKFADGGGSILVPASRVYELRMKLSAAGVNKGSINGYELLDGSSSFGQSDGQQRVQLKRALEGELTRTIQSLASVQAARVMLAMPQANGFFREQQKPTASVTVQLHPGRTLEREQIAGIVHLVASSVPELNTKAVSVVDGNGALLWPQDDRNGAQGFDSAAAALPEGGREQPPQARDGLLEPVVGRENLRATVTAEVDFSQIEVHRRGVQAQPGRRTGRRARQRTEESSQADPPSPAACPAPPATSRRCRPPRRSTARRQPLQGAQGRRCRRQQPPRSGDQLRRRQDGARDAQRHRHRAPAARRRGGQPPQQHRPQGQVTTVPLTAAELEKLTALVQQGIGFSKDRGDSVRVVNAPFRIEPTASRAVPFYLQPWVQDLLRAGLAPAALALVALVVVFALIRPAIKAATAPPVTEVSAVGGQLDAVVADDEKLPGLTGPGGVPALEEPKVNAKLAWPARALAKDNPAAVANIVRGWVSGESA